jgi:hypothetical protein
MESYLKATIGIDHAPTSYGDWLGAPEEDIIHIVNGEVWLDETGRFSTIRTAFQGYYPEPVRLRRIAHWCRYFSGMGSYALKRAILRDNEYYATITLFAGGALGGAAGLHAGEALLPLRQVDLRLFPPAAAPLHTDGAAGR